MGLSQMHSGLGYQYISLYNTSPYASLYELSDILNTLFTQTRVSKLKWQQLLGDCRSMVPDLLGSKYLFSILQTGLIQSNGKRVCLSLFTKATLCNWLYLADNIHTTPAPITMLVPTAPTHLAASNASNVGIGGFSSAPL
jgi:hypothetical protein